MARRIEAEIEGARARFILLDNIAPRTAEALWASLPIQTKLGHGRRSGDACYFKVDSPAMLDLPDEPELGYSSIYKGCIVVAAPSRAHGTVELLLSYGQADFRGRAGALTATPVAMLDGDGSQLLEAASRTWSEGDKTISLRRAEA